MPDEDAADAAACEHLPTQAGNASAFASQQEADLRGKPNNMSTDDWLFDFRACDKAVKFSKDTWCSMTEWLKELRE